MPAQDAALALITTRLEAPSPAGMIERPRFDACSPREIEGRLWILRAPAGYGKTVLAAQWFDRLRLRGNAVVWITVRSDIKTSASLAAYIDAGLDGADGAGRSEAALPSNGDDYLPRIVARLASGPPITFFIDGADQLGTTAAELIAELLLEAPASTRFVLTMRREPGFSRGGLRTRKALVELDAQRLRFSADEAAKLFDDTMPLETHFQDLGGWAAGLALLALHPPRATMQIDSYLDEEVVSQLPEEVREWLCAVSILNRFNRKLCEAMTGSSPGCAFQTFCREGLLAPSDDREDQWRRLQPGLAHSLQRRLAATDPDRSEMLHLRASRWFAANDDPLSALRHAAQAGDMQWLASLLEAECESLALEGQIDIVDQHAQQLPASILLMHPRLTAALAWLKTRSLRLDESKQLLASAQRRIADLFDRGELTAQRHEELQLHCVHQELMCAVAEGEVGKIDALSRRLLAAPEGRKPFMVYSALTQSLAVRRETYELTGIEGLVADAQAALRRDGYRTAHVTIASAAGSALFACGKVTQAIAILTEGIERSGSAGLGSIAALPLAEILFEQNELDEAQDLIDRFLPSARGFGFLDHLSPGHVIRGRLARLAKGPRAALQLLEESLGFARVTGLRRLALALGVEIVRCQIDLDRRQQAFDLASELGFANNGQAYRPKRGSTSSDEMKAIGWYHLQAGSVDSSTLFQLATDWARFGTARGAPSTAVRWQLSLAKLHVQQSEAERATRALWAALKVAEPMGLIRPFLDQIPAIHDLLKRIASTRGLVAQPVDDFAFRLAEITSGNPALCGPGGAPLSTGHFSAREIEVLSLAGHGWTNREIGDRLGLTEGTVKWHFQQIYDKLGVRRRSQAVLIARTSGLFG